MSKSTESLGECPLNHWWFTGWAANTKKPDSLTWRPITCARHMSNKWCWAAACWLHAHFKVLDHRCNRGSSLKPHFTRPCTLGLRGTIVPCDEWFSFITWIYVLKKLFHNVTKLSILWQICMSEDVNVSRCMFYFLTALDGSLVNYLWIGQLKCLVIMDWGPGFGSLSEPGSVEWHIANMWT